MSCLRPAVYHQVCDSVTLRADLHCVFAGGDNVIPLWVASVNGRCELLAVREDASLSAKIAPSPIMTVRAVLTRYCSCCDGGGTL